MLNPFPQLLIYGFFAPTLLRIMVALVLFYLAYMQWQWREHISDLRGGSYPTLSIIFNAAVGLGLLLGYYTQIAALLAIAGFGIGIYFNRRYPDIVILSTSTVLVLIGVCISILMTGAGALAFDLPL